MDRIRAQVERYLDFEGTNAARMVNNLDWTGELTAIGFLRDVGKHYRMGRMLAKETVAARLNSDEGLSFTEFSYQILQGMDFLELYRRYDCTLQTGGNDQWGNLTSGTELIRKVEGARPCTRFATPLDHQGRRHQVRQDRGRHRLARRRADQPVRLLPVLVQLPTIATSTATSRCSPSGRWTKSRELAEATRERSHAREAQRALAGEVTALVHGQQAADAAVAASAALFGRGELTAIDEPTLHAALAEAGLSTVDGPVPSVVELLRLSGLTSSLSEARRAVAEGGANINNRRVTDPDFAPGGEDLLHGKYLVLRRGKRSVAGILVRS